MPERIWDRFLTDEDKLHLSQQRRARRPNFGQRPALLYIDLYRGVFGDKPEPLMEAIKTWPGSCGMAAWNAVPYLQTLLGTARELGIPVAHVTGLPSTTGIVHWGDSKSGPIPVIPEDPDEAGRYHRRFDIIEEVAPVEGEILVRKSGPSGFWCTPLAAQLYQMGVDTLIVGGESTSGCVRASVIDACTNRFKVVVVEECVFDRHEAPHAINLFDMNQKYADVLPLAGVDAWLHAWKAGNRNAVASAKETELSLAR